MSKFVKNIITGDLKKRLTGVEHAFLVNVVGLEVNAVNRLRNDLASKNIKLLVVKNSLARRATEEGALESIFVGKIAGSTALCWGAQDIVALAKELVRLSKEKAYAKFEIRGCVLDGEAFDATQAIDISKWPTREEQIAILLGQIVGVGGKLSSQLISGGAKLASQIKQLIESEEDAEPVAEVAATESDVAESVVAETEVA